MLEQRIAQWEEELVQKGKIEGRLLGKEEGKAEGILIGVKAELARQKTTLFEMLLDRFEIIPTSWASTIKGIDNPDILNILIRNIYKVKSSQEFGEFLTRNQ